MTTIVVSVKENHPRRVSTATHISPTLGSSHHILAVGSTGDSYVNQETISHSDPENLSSNSASMNPSEAPDILDKKASLRSRLFQLERSESHTFRAPFEFYFTGMASEHTGIEIPIVATGDQGKAKTEVTTKAAAEVSVELSPKENLLTPHRQALPPPPSGARGHRRRSAMIDVGIFGAELASGAIPMASPPLIRTPESATAAAHDRALAVRAELLREESEAGGNHQDHRDRASNDNGSGQAELKDSIKSNQKRKAKPGNPGKRVTWSDPLTQIFSTETLIEDPAHSDQGEDFRVTGIRMGRETPIWG